MKTQRKTERRKITNEIKYVILIKSQVSREKFCCGDVSDFPSFLSKSTS